MTNIPYDEDSFDVVFTYEELEYDVDIESVIRELARVTELGGRIIVVDKSESALGEKKITLWEQWVEKVVVQNIMVEYCTRSWCIPMCLTKMCRELICFLFRSEK